MTMFNPHPHPHPHPHRIGGSVRVFAVPVAMALTLAVTAVPMTAAAATTQKITASAHGQRISVKVPTNLLATEDGAARLYRALESKAEKSCKRTIPMRLGESVPVKRCARELLNGFIAELDHDGMTALHAAAD